MDMQLINLTPHAVDIMSTAGIVKTIPASGMVARLTTSTQVVGEVDGIRLTKTVFGEPTALPEQKDDTFYIVSQLIKNALPQRSDLLVPAEVLRDNQGKILYCQSLGQ